MQVIPAVMIIRYGGLYTQHRTAVVLATRLLEFYITHAYLSFWADSSDQDVFAEWIVLACVFANNSISMAAWCAISLPSHRSICMVRAEVLDPIVSLLWTPSLWCII